MSGQKTVETRAGSAGPRSYTHVAPGDSILFLCGPHRLRRQVCRVAVYPSVDALAAYEDFRSIAPWLTNAADLAVLYASFPGYPERIAQYGLVAMELGTATSE